MVIKNLRIARGLSQEQLAKAIGVSRQTVVYWEDQRGLPSVKNLMRLAEFFGVPFDSLLPAKTGEEA